MNSAIIRILMRAFGVVLIGLAIYRGFKGQFKSEDNTGGMEVLDRRTSPVRFWGQLLVQAIIGAVLALGVIQV